VEARRFVSLTPLISPFSFTPTNLYLLCSLSCPEMAKFPTGGRAYFFVPIQSPSPSHLAIIMFPSEWRYALIRSRSVVENGYRWLVLAEELGWIDTETLLASAPGREKQGKGGGVLGKRGWDRERKEENVGDHGSRSRSVSAQAPCEGVRELIFAHVCSLQVYAFSR
jgi:hypothetical protein